MIQENEIIMCVLGIGTLTFMLLKYKILKRIPSFNLLAVGFCLLVTGWIFTAMEGFFWEEILNFLEHLCYAASTLMVTIWYWKAFDRLKGHR